MKFINIILPIINKIKDPLHKNAIFLMMNSLGTSGFGFIFWIIVARLYVPEDVGIASAIISFMILLALLANLGFGIGIIRFLGSMDERESNAIINSCFIISGTFALIFASIFLLGLDLWSEKLVFLKEDPLYIILFLIFTIIAVLMALLNSVFIARKSAIFVFIKDTGIFSFLKIVLPFFLISFGSMGIFFAWGIASAIAFILGMILFIPVVQNRYRFKLEIEKRVINNMIHFSVGNHIGDIFRMLPSLILPLLIVNILSSQDAAYFYISWMMANLLFMVPLAITTSLLAESSGGEKDYGENVNKSLKLIFLFLIPTILILIFLGDVILQLIGQEYSDNAFNLLRLFSLSSIPLALNTVYITIKRIEKKFWEAILIYGSITIATFIGIFITIEGAGLDSVGNAWLISQTLLCLIIAVPLLKKLKWIS